MSAENLIIILLLLPVFGAFGIVLARRHPNRREAVTLTTALALFVGVCQLLGPVLAGARPRVVVLELLHDLGKEGFGYRAGT